MRDYFLNEFSCVVAFYGTSNNVKLFVTASVLRMSSEMSRVISLAKIGVSLHLQSWWTPPVWSHSSDLWNDKRILKNICTKNMSRKQVVGAQLTTEYSNVWPRHERILSISNFFLSALKVAFIIWYESNLGLVTWARASQLTQATQYTPCSPVIAAFGNLMLEWSHILYRPHNVFVHWLTGRTGLLPGLRQPPPGHVNTGALGHWPRGGGVLLPGLRHLEDDLHVVGGAAAAHPPVQVPGAAGGDEVVILTWPELQTPGCRTKWPGKGNILIEASKNIITVTFDWYIR